MDTLLSALAFAAFIVAQVAAVIAVHAERQARPSEALGARLDHLARVIRNSGG
jgi:hypothetical protein